MTRQPFRKAEKVVRPTIKPKNSPPIQPSVYLISKAVAKEIEEKGIKMPPWYEQYKNMPLNEIE